MLTTTESPQRQAPYKAAGDSLNVLPVAGSDTIKTPLDSSYPWMTMKCPTGPLEGRTKAISFEPLPNDPYNSSGEPGRPA